MIKKVGITGGIGSGKSFICQVIEKMGFPVYYSDSESKKIIQTDPEIRLKLTALYGQEVFSNNSLNRTFLAEQIFKSDENRLKVNAIIHPKVRAHFKEWVDTQSSHIVFNEAAILFETGAYKNFDHVILVTAPEETRISRVMQRDNISIEEVELRISKQWSDEEKKGYTNLVIENDGRPILSQIEAIIEKIEGENL